ncbi:MAG: hypothetical protein K8I30_08435, partial [Anaerolineae bacterium]|nr:hypothetical protein [Anaerolineae bacterium]
MQAGVLEANEHFALRDWPTPTPGDGEVLLRIHASGVCMSEVGSWKLGPIARAYPDENVLDWELEHQDTPTYQRQYPHLMGHEP